MRLPRLALTRFLPALTLFFASTLNAAPVTLSVTWTAQQIADAYQAAFGNSDHSLYNPVDGMGVGLVDFFVRPDNPVFSYSLAAAEVQTSFSGYQGSAEETSPPGSSEVTGQFSRWARWADAVAAPVNLLTTYSGPALSVLDGVTPFGFVPMDTRFTVTFNNVNLPGGTVGQFRWYVYGVTLQWDVDDQWYGDPYSKAVELSFTMPGTFETPEPGSLGLLVIGGAMLLAVRRKVQMGRS